ncbi:hypothetical protein [Sphingomonas sp. Leaf25]|uniref:hypothetical protein n=1 Tax=Sphingomonas sp. Leaf25 TaxID=1735692 RepID=UPI0006FD0FAD|nr:hypothetical protein [Sphingomonas sp. Leaf25]KQN03613.1 hypothetical protein ASE78_00540 [Sphingomonas sp. Leaf25]
MRRFLLLLAACAALPAAAQTTPAPAPAPTAAEQAELDRITARGRLIAAYDRAAWLGTDDALPRLGQRRDQLGGWIVDGPASEPTVVFHDRSNPQRALYSARLVGGKLVNATMLSGDAAILSPDRLRLIAARNAAARAIGAAGIGPCGSSFNTVVVPPPTATGPTSVYFLSPQMKAGEMPIGGHYRVDVAVDGTPGTPYAFSKGCMTLPPPPPGIREALAIASTLTAPLPNETHSFAVEAYRRPLVVMIPGPARAFLLRPGQPVRPFDMPATPRR